MRALVVLQEPETPAQLTPTECDADCEHHRPVRLSWAQLIERMFEIVVEHRPNCGGKLKTIAAILEACESAPRLIRPPTLPPPCR